MTTVLDRPVTMAPTIKSVNAALDQMNDDERVAVMNHLSDLLQPDSALEVPTEVKAVIRNRAADLDADPSIGLSHEEVMERVRERWSTRINSVVEPVASY